ncbi:hypothetical protein FNF31_01316 [Cafeteria roenbergensis]|uniref:Uncharacterized protein n=1 Tax=Cafeteria roenbergensis TaxID=33653 RepID=A0A5A8DMU5_CAFRO|nr:hypothetical protein FNF31_01316 [Cafeteria roenbergensis]
MHRSHDADLVDAAEAAPAAATLLRRVFDAAPAECAAAFAGVLLVPVPRPPRPAVGAASPTPIAVPTVAAGLATSKSSPQPGEAAAKLADNGRSKAPGGAVNVGLVVACASFAPDLDNGRPEHPAMATAAASGDVAQLQAAALAAIFGAAEEGHGIVQAKLALGRLEAAQRAKGVAVPDGGVALDVAAGSGGIVAPAHWQLSFEPVAVPGEQDGLRRPVLAAPHWGADCIAASDLAALVPTVAEFVTGNASAAGPDSTARAALVVGSSTSPGTDGAWADIPAASATLAQTLALLALGGFDVSADAASGWPVSASARRGDRSALIQAGPGGECRVTRASDSKVVACRGPWEAAAACLML